MKKAAVSIVVLVLLVIGGLLVLPSFWDWNGEKGRIAALVKEQTGRDLTIAGDVSLRLLPAPAFAAREVTLANVEGGSDPAMVQLEELQIRVALAPLLGGKVRVESVTLVKPEVLLEVLPDGRVNWTFAAAQASPAGAPAASGSGDEPDSGAAGEESIRVDSFIIEDGTLRYRDARSGRAEVLTGLNAELGAESLIGPFVVVGSAVYQEVPLEFDFSLDRLVDDGATALSLSLGLPRSAASGTFLGALSRHQDLQTLRGRLQAEGEDLARLIRGLPLAETPSDLPSQLARPFAVTAEISGSDNEATAEAITFKLGDVSLDGEAAATFGEVPDITASFSTKTIDLDKLLSQEAKGEGGEARSGGQTAEAPAAREDDGAAAAGEAPGLPRDVTASLKLSAGALLYRGQTVRQVDIVARLADGKLEVEKAAAQLPGSSDVSLAGQLSLTPQGPRFGGTVAASSDNLRGLLHWLGVDIAAVPPERLRRLSLKTGVDAAPGQITLRDIDLSLDVSRLTGGVAVALRDRPGFGIGVSLDRINLDAYLPEMTAASPAPSQEAAPGATQGEGAAPQAGAGASQAPPPAGLALLGRFDANIDVKVGQMTYRGLPLNGLRLDATLQRGGLVVRELSVADLAGSRGRFAGSLANVDRDPSLDGSLDVSVAALSRLAKAFGVSTGGQLPLESFTLSGAVNGNREALRFDQKLAALGGNLRAAGKAELQPAAPSVDAVLELDHPNLSVLMGELLREASVPAGLGPVALKGRLAAAPGAVSLSGLTGQAAGTEVLSGDVSVNLAALRPKITADLETGVLPLAALGAPAAGGGKAKKNGGSGSAAGSSAAAGRERWSTKPIDVSALRGLDADIKLRAKAIVADKLRLDKAEVEAVLADGILDLRKFNAQTYGGALAVTGKADFRESAPGGMEVAAAVTAIDVELKELLGALADSDRFSGPISLESSLNTRGLSEAALVSALNGRGKLDGTVTVAAKVEEQAGALVLNLLGKKVKEVRGVTDSTTMLFSAFAGAPAKIDGTFAMEQGVLRSDDLTVRGRDAQALTAGNVNLPSWHMESRTDVFRDADPQNAFLTAVLRGPPDSPNVRISGQPFQRREEPAAAEQPAVIQVPEQGQEQESPAQPMKPEDLLKEGVKGLLKGLGG
ncbi:AsmA family protein [Pelagibius marinus]|uniref:AsmA family protein n=1 Tax=Pelagibius marinus TaxID=2762760 RepID=UPI001872849C|nr:AsmA family protein [Pelagibius marinus]